MRAKNPTIPLCACGARHITACSTKRTRHGLCKTHVAPCFGGMVTFTANFFGLGHRASTDGSIMPRFYQIEGFTGQEPRIGKRIRVTIQEVD